MYARRIIFCQSRIVVDCTALVMPIQKGHRRFESYLWLQTFTFFIMSLLSQKDRQNVIKALDFLLFSKSEDMSEQERAELNALLNWIKLEYNKNEN